MELHRKIKHNEKVCRAHDIGSYVQGHGRNQVRCQNRVSAITKILLKQIKKKLHRKIEHNKKTCSAHELGSYTQGQGHNRARGQIVP